MNRAQIVSLLAALDTLPTSPTLRRIEAALILARVRAENGGVEKKHT